ncbi:MAG: biopolymer transporter ExbD [Desulfobulbaceae bacterium]|nr:biopolymer transporter ExbD [Desulfobulbaceae bacterium]
MKITLPEQYTTRVEMLPLIDIVFLLLVFFIYAMLSMAVHRGMDVELPRSTNATPEKELTLSVTVRHLEDGASRIFLDQKRVDPDQLAVLLAQRAEQEKKRSNREPGVLLFADRQVDYQELFKVLDQISRAGLNRISLQADAEPE